MAGKLTFSEPWKGTQTRQIYLDDKLVGELARKSEGTWRIHFEGCPTIKALDYFSLEGIKQQAQDCWDAHNTDLI